MPATTVLLIPGFAGTGLDLPRPKSNLPPLKIWINRTELGISGLDDLQLDGSGLNPGPLASGPLTADGFSIEGLYLPMLLRLANAGYLPVPVYWDWRKSVTLLANFLTHQFIALDAAGPWAVIAHSFAAMGTLLAWVDFAALGPPKNLKRILWVTPALGGSYGAPFCMAGGNFDELSWGLIATILQGVSGIVTRPNHFLYPLSSRLDASVASWPGLYELFPSTQGPWAGLDPNAGLFLSAANWDENPYFQQVWADSALAVHKRMAAAMVGPLPPSVVVHTTPARTLAGTPTNKGAWAERSAYPTSGQGDGTLLWVRSVFPGIPTLTVGSDHPSACADPQLRDNVADLIEGGLTVDTDLPPLPIEPKALAPTVEPRTTIPGPWPVLQIRGDP